MALLQFFGRRESSPSASPGSTDTATSPSSCSSPESQALVLSPASSAGGSDSALDGAADSEEWEVKDFSRVFRRLDTDGDGYVNFSELWHHVSEHPRFLTLLTGSLTIGDARSRSVTAFKKSLRARKPKRSGGRSYAKPWQTAKTHDATGAGAGAGAVAAGDALSLACMPSGGARSVSRRRGLCIRC